MILKDDEIESLINMPKIREEDESVIFPQGGQRVSIPLISQDETESFFLDINSARIKLEKATYQNRARGNIILLRLDIEGPPHRNPDGQEVECPHLHIYREGYGDKWAYPASDYFELSSDKMENLEAFMSYCNIITPPEFEYSLFVS